MSPGTSTKPGQPGLQIQSQPSELVNMEVKKQAAAEAAANPLRQSGQNIVGGLAANASGQSLVQNIDAYGNTMTSPGVAYGPDPTAQQGPGSQNYMDLISQISDERISGYPQPQLYD